MQTPKLPPNAVEKSAPAAAQTVPWERVERFVGQFTHDIRNGLNAIELQLTFLSEITTDPEASAEIKQLRGTLGEISRQLQAVRLKTGSVSAHSMEYPAGDFFEDLRERFERLHASAASRVHWEIAVTGATLLVDPELSINALLEIVGNALQFGGDAGEVIFTAATTAGGIRVAVSQGLAQAPAVPLESWGQEPLLSTKRAAYGLGLFRARRVFDAQGATIEAAWDAAKSVFTVAIILPSPAAAAADKSA